MIVFPEIYVLTSIKIVSRVFDMLEALSSSNAILTLSFMFPSSDKINIT